MQPPCASSADDILAGNRCVPQLGRLETKGRRHRFRSKPDAADHSATRQQWQRHMIVDTDDLHLARPVEE